MFDLYLLVHQITCFKKRNTHTHTHTVNKDLQSLEADEASEHASLQSSQLVPGQQQLQNSTRSIKRTFTDVPQLVVAEVAAAVKEMIIDRFRFRLFSSYRRGLLVVFFSFQSSVAAINT